MFHKGESRDVFDLYWSVILNNQCMCFWVNQLCIESRF
ncbi:hypothetical protein LEP1GSC008_0321 [Leptospira kirschneri serovar Bulgarica str. Nikolaevo]|uniref:Uncharacterized protein n=1 Tax=Leptospira kirschneri serovar Bulgarica str. Nikolaevo TaxID=1240687 RepID=M6FBT2_9LEPT|nr:hypothetical protein LEP1GSC008_0321 [Leptospira kirschneri serovar Bulgarica str. Nikolaevo]